jgi:hypothetical protein
VCHVCNPNANCATCQDADSCLTCPAGYTRDDVSGVCNLQCPTSEYNDHGSCAPCNDTCSTCSGPLANECLTCTLPRFLYQGECLLTCPADALECHGENFEFELSLIRISIFIRWLWRRKIPRRRHMRGLSH